MTDANPWLIGAEQPPAPDTPVPSAASQSRVRLGASAPQPGLQVPDTADRLPRRTQGQPATIWWLGVHGGAGESTLSALATGTRPADHAWPVPAVRGTTHRVALVARTNYAGLIAAQRAATEWASDTVPDVQVVGLVLMPDAPGRLPRPLREFHQLIAGGLPRVWVMPWVNAWRLGPPMPGEYLPKQFRDLFTELSLTPPSAPTAN